jgi:uncharacterized protein YcbK (DUF882 family)
MLFPLIAIVSTAAQPPSPPQYRLVLHHLHTGEQLSIVYREGDHYVPAAVQALDYFLRDHRTQEATDLDPRLFDLLHDLANAVGHPSAEIDIVCGYRSPWSNDFLRRASQGVAKHSMHVQGKAIDIRMPGVSTVELRDAALSLHRGGVGYYPRSQFVHVDVGQVRQWQWPTP